MTAFRCNPRVSSEKIIFPPADASPCPRLQASSVILDHSEAPPMCGIVGLFLKDRGAGARARRADRRHARRDVRPRAGFGGFRGVWHRRAAGSIKLTVRGPEGTDFAALGARIEAATDALATVSPRATHAVLSVPAAQEGGGARGAGRGGAGDAHGRRGIAHGALQGGRPALAGGDPLRARHHERHPRHRPHPHGHRERGDHRRRPPLLHRTGPVPGAQWLAVEPCRGAPRAGARGAQARHRQPTARSPPPISPTA